MKFRQIIEIRTSHIDDFNSHLDAWITRTKGQRIPHQVVVCKDRDAENVYLMTVEFASHAVGMKKHGFIPFVFEWWHYDYVGWENYPPLDVSFENLMRGAKSAARPR